jgi:hypothetical protein
VCVLPAARMLLAGVDVMSVHVNDAFTLTNYSRWF